MRAFFDHSPRKASRETISEKQHRVKTKVQIGDKTVVNQGNCNTKKLQISGSNATLFERLPSKLTACGWPEALSWNLSRPWARSSGGQLLNPNGGFCGQIRRWETLACDKPPNCAEPPFLMQNGESTQTDRRRTRDSVNKGPLHLNRWTQF